MVTRDTAWAPGTPCWVDLGVADIPKADTFYSSLFGWEIFDTGPDGGGYRMCSIGGRPVAGIGAKSEPDIGTFWTTYIASADADATATKIKAAGGQVVMEPFDVMDVGRMLIAVDPGGAMFGVWQARSHTGMQVANEPGSVTWNENMSRQFAANKAFYGSVFGYDFGDIGAEGMEYETIDLGGASVGGIGGIGPEQPADTPARWVTYFAVADADAALERVTELGGSVIAPAWDTPYGRMGFARDDQGAEFAVMSPVQGAEG
jgi:predicted enzyme related to lactoylglutathione lyase